ncbi:MAG: tRNA sulfurtransferase [Candidatus Odinarchaeia archaeon]
MVCLLSGGIDSPIAAYLMIKNGCKAVFVHLYNKTLVRQAVLLKLENIVKQLTKFQHTSKLYLVPFDSVQMEIIKHIPSKVRMIIYRRFMMKIASKIAEIEKSWGIVTGDSLGQVASQTLKNLRSIYEAAKFPVLAPLVGMDKDEVIKIAKSIQTYTHSIIPYPDCCSFMITQHPETHSNLRDVIKLDELIRDQYKLIQEAVSNAIVKKFKLTKCSGENRVKVLTTS